MHFVPRFDARDSSPEPETPQIFAPVLDKDGEKYRKTEKSGSLSTLLSPLHVNFSEVSDFSGLL